MLLDFRDWESTTAVTFHPLWAYLSGHQSPQYRWFRTALHLLMLITGATVLGVFVLLLEQPYLGLLHQWPFVFSNFEVLKFNNSNSWTRHRIHHSNCSKMSSSNLAFDLDIPHHCEVIERALAMHKNAFMSSKKGAPQSCVYSLLRLWFQCIHQDQACRLWVEWKTK